MVNNSEKEDDNELVICEMNKAMHKLGIKEGTLLKCINDNHLSELHSELSPFSLTGLGSLHVKTIKTNEDQYLMFLGIEQIDPMRVRTSYSGTPTQVSHPYVIKLLYGEEIIYLPVKPDNFLTVFCGHFEIPGEK